MNTIVDEQTAVLFNAEIVKATEKLGKYEREQYVQFVAPQISIEGENIYAMCQLNVYSLERGQHSRIGHIALIVTPEYLAIEFFTGG